MKAVCKYLGFLVLGAVLTAPIAISTKAASQDDRHQEDNHRDKKQKRVYDRSHKDYHNWDDNEDRAYRQYLGDQHIVYRDISKLKRNQQTAYWNWRHDHPDHD